MLEVISTTIERKIVEKIRQSETIPYEISVLIDESMCNSRKENLLIFVKYYDPTDLTTKIAYLSNTIILKAKELLFSRAFKKFWTKISFFFKKSFAWGLMMLKTWLLKISEFT